MTQEDGAPPVQENDATQVSADGQQVAATGEDRVAELEARIAELERSLATERDAANDYMQRWQRAQADFANFKRRGQQEQEQRELLATGRVLATMLPALDSFERAFQALPPSLRYFSWIDGVALIEMQLRRALEMHEVKPVQAAPGGAFDPLRHESIGMVETSEHPEGQIAAVVQTGYDLRGFILRPALVQLAKAPASDEAKAAEVETPQAEESSIATEEMNTNSEPSATAGAGSRSNRDREDS